MNPYLILRLTNAAIACDKRKDFALAELLTETVKELEGIKKRIDELTDPNIKYPDPKDWRG